jgi:kynureninase
MTASSREQAAAEDRACPLTPYRDLFVFGAGGPIYLDGNSLGRQPRGTAGALARVLEEWADDLVQGWDRWAGLSAAVGDRLAPLLGAAGGQVLVCDSTTVNLYKLAAAALEARPGRQVIVGDAHDFPTVRYVLQGLARQPGRRLRLVDAGPTVALGGEELSGVLAGTAAGEVALVCLSGVNYRSGAVADMAGVNDVAHRAGALVLWDLSHAAGAVPLSLDADGADMAVGCGYKYLNGGPGAPSWLYVRAARHAELASPIWGWWGQAGQFDMGPTYQPAPGVGRFLAGTPDVLGLASLDAGIAPLLQAGIPALWHKTRSLVALLAARAEELLGPLGASLASPPDPGPRGGHLAISHPHARAASYLLRQRRLVVADFRPPDVLRLAPVALYTSRVEVWDAVPHIASVLSDPAVRSAPPSSWVT